MGSGSRAAPVTSSEGDDGETRSSTGYSEARLANSVISSKKQDRSNAL